MLRLTTTAYKTMALLTTTYGKIFCVFVFVNCGQSKSYSGSLDSPSYLAALQLRGSSPGRQEEEAAILNDIKRIQNIQRQNNDIQNNQPGLEIDSEQKYGLRPEKPYVEMPLKRYMEFVGKRSEDVPLKRFAEFPGKRFAEFPGKRFYEYPLEKLYELPAKRDFQSVAPSKRYHEFLGKRNSHDATRSELDVYKRWAEFLGKRGQGAESVSLTHDDDLATFYDDSLNEADAEAKRFAEFVG